MLDRLTKPWVAAGVVFIITFVVYMLTMDPSMGYIDAGELSAVCATLGIAHPSGYPLFTLIGWVFAQLPIAESVIVRLNIMAALFTAAGAGAVLFLTREIMLYWVLWKKPEFKDSIAAKQKIVEVKDAGIATMTGFVSALALAFSLTWWQQATSVEVYSLHALLLPLVILAFLRMLRRESVQEVRRDGWLFAFLLGLAFTNHLTTIVLAPGFLYLYFAQYGLKKSSVAKIAKLAPAFLGALLVYLYLPLRASADPILNWGDPSSLDAFLKHITGGQYKVWMFTGQDAGEQFKTFWLELFATGFNTIFTFLSLAVGVGALALNAKGLTAKMLVFTLLLFLSSLFYAINYDINDIRSYYLLAYVVAAIWIGVGTNYISFRDDLSDKRKLSLLVEALLIGGWQLIAQWNDASEAENYLVEDYTRNMLTNLPQNAVIFSTQWDFWVSSALYYQLVEGLRTDVVVIDKHLLRDRPWYFEHLKQRAPAMMARVKPEADRFLTYLVPFDKGEPFDETAIAPAYQAFTTALIEKNRDRPLFMTTEMLEERDELFAPGIAPQPAGVALAINGVSPTTTPKIVWRTSPEFERRGYYPDNTRMQQALPLAMTAEQLAREGNVALALQYCDLALRMKPAPIEDPFVVPEKERDMALNVDTRFAAIQDLRNNLAAAASNP